MKSEIKENVQETNSDKKETGTQINNLEQKEEINFSNWNRMKKQEFKKNEERLRNLQDNFEGEDKEQEIENLFEQIVKDNFPNLAKEIDFQEVQQAQRVPKKLDPKRNTPRHIIITLPKIKEKERLLKAAREKETVTYKGVPTRLSANETL